MTPTPTEVSAAMEWLAQRGGPFYPSAAGHVEVIREHIAELERQIEALILSRDCPIQGSD